MMNKQLIKQTLFTCSFHRGFPDEKGAVRFIDSVRRDGKPVVRCLTHRELTQ